MISTLIDKQDTFEIVRDQIAAILKTEIANQRVLATAANRDPADWKLRIFTERSNPLEEWLNIDDETDLSPIVVVWFDNSLYDRKATSGIERQKSETVFNIDCYGVGVTADNPAGGHTPGDREAAFEVQRAYRLVRNILMAAEYLYLDLRGLVGSRWPQAVTAFQPELDGRAVQHLQGLRLALRVTFNEFSPQVSEEVLEFVGIDFKRAEDGEILVEADYDYTL